jgi:hypothetical protein
MGEILINFDETDKVVNETHKLTLKTRTENIVRLLNISKGQGLISKREVVLALYLTESLTREVNGYCVTIIVNTLEEYIVIDPAQIELEEVEDDYDNIVFTFSNLVVENSSRLSKLRDELRMAHSNIEERVSFIKSCDEFNDVIHSLGDKLIFNTAAENAIPTPTIDPTRRINTKPCGIPEVHRDEVRRQTAQMLRVAIIVPSNSPCNSPSLVVPNKEEASRNKKWRIVVDFKIINDVTIGDSFSIPVIKEILNALGKSKYFSTIDSASGFLEFSVRHEDQARTAFGTREGHFQYKLMPFGSKEAPATFQRPMNTVLSGIQGISCPVYLDNVILYGENLGVHYERLR